MKMLNGREIVGYIKERQAKQVRGLRQSGRVEPKLAIIQTTSDPATNVYTNLKKKYGDDINVDVEIHNVKQSDALDTIKSLNIDDSAHGIIVQLPLEDKTQQNEILNAVIPSKDVDGLGEESDYDPATPLAITWLLAGYGVELRGKKIAIIGQGALVGAPLAKMFKNSGLDVETADINTPDIAMILKDKEVVITATGQPGLITADMLADKAVVVDAGVASDKGELRGDLAEDVYERDDIKVTPKKGGVGPLTVSALFDNVIRAANKRREDV